MSRLVPNEIQAIPGIFSPDAARRYVEELRASLDPDRAESDLHVRDLDIAGITVRLRLAGQMAEALFPALAHLPNGVGNPHVVLEGWDTASTGIRPPHPPFTPEDYHRYGQRAVVYGESIALMHAPTTPILCAYDRKTRHGIFWTADATALSIYERAAPMQTLFHWALGEFGWQIVHAAAVGNETGGLLLIGGTGAGKSTTALSCLDDSPLRFLCDDKCLVRLEPEPQVFALFSSAKIKGDMLARFPLLKERLQGWDAHFKAGKGLVFLHPDFSDRMIRSFPIQALLIPRVKRNEQAQLHPASPRKIFLALGPSTAIWLPGAEADNYRFTAELTRRLPCHQLDLALEPSRNTAALATLLEELS